MNKPGIDRDELVKRLDEAIPEPLRYEYYEIPDKKAITMYEEKGRLRTAAERIVGALKRPVEALLRWWRRVVDKGA